VIIFAFDFVSFANEILEFLGIFGIVVVIIFGIMHPLFENPLSLLNMSLSIAILDIPIGFLVVFISNIIGILLLYFFAKRFNEKSDDFLFRKNSSEKALKWINSTRTWKHIIVIGMPLVPTYFIKIAVPLSKVSFRKYLIILIGAYIFLYFGNFLIYFGVLGFVTDYIPSYVSFILLTIFVIFVYFGNNILRFNKIN